MMTAAALTTRIVRSPEGLKALRKPWHRLQCKVGPMNAFASHAMADVWWQHFAGERGLHVLVVEEEGALVGVLPLMIDQQPVQNARVRLLTTLHNEHAARHAPVFDPQRRDVARAMIDLLHDCRAHWDWLRLEGVSLDDPQTAVLMEVLGERDWRAYAEATGEAWLSLAPSELSERVSASGAAMEIESGERLARLWRVMDDAAVETRSFSEIERRYHTTLARRIREDDASGGGCNLFAHVNGSDAGAVHFLRHLGTSTCMLRAGPDAAVERILEHYATHDHADGAVVDLHRVRLNGLPPADDVQTSCGSRLWACSPRTMPGLFWHARVDRPPTAGDAVPIDGPELRVRDVDNITDLEALSEDWEELLECCPNANLFMSHAFACAWWRSFGDRKELAISLVYQGDRLIGIAPMMIARTSYSGLPARMLSFMVNKHTSRVDFIVAANRRDVVLEAIVEHWAARAGDWDVLRLEGLPGSTGVIDRLEHELAGSRLLPFPRERLRELFLITINDTYDGLLARRSRSFRKNRHLYMNRCEKAGDLSLDFHDDPDELDASMERYYRLEPKSWKGADDGARFDDVDRAFHIDLAKRLLSRGGAYRNHFVNISGEDVAGIHVILYREVAYFFLTLFDQSKAELGPGSVVVDQAVRGAFATPGLREIDFNGYSRVAHTWCDDFRPHEVLSACSPTIRGRAIATLRRVKRGLAARGTNSTPDGSGDAAR